ncbi:hypothetical protein YEP4_09477 [Yersinia enterocolitica subsp. palearctica YE-P4]|nr:hypothetical protein YE149_09566 [Yersinia enterocolitica subsp. palearctica YE-149]EOR77066.1 hypothetical protein YE150_09519 [Yersinia enterocolitica subsp. palearctica YE-150]EOR77320.1 hypothetical protein YEP1_09598 [Yersinia enterocolitica subsp. palearctica YE-P1]EOR82493.1 hypothetical protein YEP4_09477 [Yersinia enterocolitica subsp. palearctica YE-P4]
MNKASICRPYQTADKPRRCYWQGEDRQKSKASAPGKGLRRLYDLPVLSVAGTLSLSCYWFITC